MLKIEPASAEQKKMAEHPEIERLVPILPKGGCFQPPGICAKLISPFHVHRFYLDIKDINADPFFEAAINELDPKRILQTIEQSAEFPLFQQELSLLFIKRYFSPSAKDRIEKITDEHMTSFGKINFTCLFSAAEIYNFLKSILNIESKFVPPNLSLVDGAVDHFLENNKNEAIEKQKQNEANKFYAFIKAVFQNPAFETKLFLAKPDRNFFERFLFIALTKTEKEDEKKLFNFLFENKLIPSQGFQNDKKWYGYRILAKTMIKIISSTINPDYQSEKSAAAFPLIIQFCLTIPKEQFTFALLDIIADKAALESSFYKTIEFVAALNNEVTNYINLSGLQIIIQEKRGYTDASIETGEWAKIANCLTILMLANSMIKSSSSLALQKFKELNLKLRNKLFHIFVPLVFQKNERSQDNFVNFFRDKEIKHALVEFLKKQKLSIAQQAHLLNQNSILYQIINHDRSTSAVYPANKTSSSQELLKHFGLDKKLYFFENKKTGEFYSLDRAIENLNVEDVRFFLELDMGIDDIQENNLAALFNKKSADGTSNVDEILNLLLTYPNSCQYFLNVIKFSTQALYEPFKTYVKNKPQLIYDILTNCFYKAHPLNILYIINIINKSDCNQFYTSPNTQSPWKIQKKSITFTNYLISEINKKYLKNRPLIFYIEDIFEIIIIDPAEAIFVKISSAMDYFYRYDNETIEKTKSILDGFFHSFRITNENIKTVVDGLLKKPDFDEMHGFKAYLISYLISYILPANQTLSDILAQVEIKSDSQALILKTLSRQDYPESHFNFLMETSILKKLDISMLISMNQIDISTLQSILCKIMIQKNNTSFLETLSSLGIHLNAKPFQLFDKSSYPNTFRVFSIDNLMLVNQIIAKLWSCISLYNKKALFELVFKDEAIFYIQHIIHADNLTLKRIVIEILKEPNNDRLDKLEKIFKIDDKLNEWIVPLKNKLNTVFNGKIEEIIQAKIAIINKLRDNKENEFYKLLNDNFSLIIDFVTAENIEELEKILEDNSHLIQELFRHFDYLKEISDKNLRTFTAFLLSGSQNRSLPELIDYNQFSDLSLQALFNYFYKTKEKKDYIYSCDYFDRIIISILTKNSNILVNPNLFSNELKDFIANHTLPYIVLKTKWKVFFSILSSPIFTIPKQDILNLYENYFTDGNFFTKALQVLSPCLNAQFQIDNINDTAKANLLDLALHFNKKLFLSPLSNICSQLSDQTKQTLYTEIFVQTDSCLARIFTLANPSTKQKSSFFKAVPTDDVLEELKTLLKKPENPAKNGFNPAPEPKKQPKPFSPHDLL